MPNSNESNNKKGRKRRPALTPEGRENQVISSAYDLAEKQILNGTASSQVITHFLKLGSSTERLEREKKKHEIELTKAKAEHLKAQERQEELFKEALEAMRSYSGNSGGDHDY